MRVCGAVDRPHIHNQLRSQSRAHVRNTFIDRSNNTPPIHTNYPINASISQVAAPVLAYVTFFTWRATRTYLEIVAEEAEAAEAAGKG